jgi:hypothetical protein
MTRVAAKDRICCPFGTVNLVKPARKMQIMVSPERPRSEPEGTVMNETRIYTIKTLVMPTVVGSRPKRRRRGSRCKVILHDLLAAEQVLDFVERKGGTDTRLDIAGKAFVVRWRDGG